MPAVDLLQDYRQVGIPSRGVDAAAIVAAQTLLVIPGSFARLETRRGRRISRPRRYGDTLHLSVFSPMMHACSAMAPDCPTVHTIIVRHAMPSVAQREYTSCLMQCSENFSGVSMPIFFLFPCRLHDFHGTPS